MTPLGDDAVDCLWSELKGLAGVLARDNERYARFFDFAPDAYLVTDAGGSIREANHSALELLRGEREAVLDRPLAEFIAPGEPLDFLEGARPGARRRVRMQQATGEAFAADVTARAVPLRKSGAGGLCWLLRTAD